MNKPFSGWKEGFPFYAPVLAAAVLLGFFPVIGWFAPVVALLGVCVALFFRDFPRTISAADHEVVSPADGTVVAIEDLDESPHYDGPTRRVSIFLSVFNAHLNRAPYPGTVTAVKYAPGLFKDARGVLSLDIENVANLVNNDWGRLAQVSFPHFAQALDATIQPNGRYLYRPLAGVSGTNAPFYSISALPSVWRVQLGVRYEF